MAGWWAGGWEVPGDSGNQSSLIDSTPAFLEKVFCASSPIPTPIFFFFLNETDLFLSQEIDM